MFFLNLRNILYFNLSIKFISFLIIILTIGIPINTWWEYLIISLFILGCLFGKLSKNKNLIYLLILFLILFNVIKLILPNNSIIEKHGIYGTPNNLTNFQNPILPSIIDEIGLKELTKKNDYFVNVDIQRKWSFSADSFWTKDSYSREFSNLNFVDRYQLNIGQFNDSAYYINDSYDLYYPLIFAFKFNKLIADEICWKGMLFFPNNKNEYSLKKNKNL